MRQPHRARVTQYDIAPSLFELSSFGMHYISWFLELLTDKFPAYSFRLVFIIARYFSFFNIFRAFDVNFASYSLAFLSNATLPRRHGMPFSSIFSPRWLEVYRLSLISRFGWIYFKPPSVFIIDRHDESILMIAPHYFHWIFCHHCRFAPRHCHDILFLYFSISVLISLVWESRMSLLDFATHAPNFIHLPYLRWELIISITEYVRRYAAPLPARHLLPPNSAIFPRSSYSPII